MVVEFERKQFMNRQRVITSILVAVALTAIGSVAVFAVNANKDKKDNSAPVSSQKPEQKLKTEAKAPSKNLDPTASWQVYDNEKYSLKYPADWKHIPTKMHPTQPDDFTSPDYQEQEQQGLGPGGTVISSGTKLGVSVEQSQGSLEDYLTAVIIERRDITVDGQPAIQTDNKFENSFSTTTVFQKNGFSYIISRKYPEGAKDKYADSYNKILKSFKTK